jgi:hypothetical protein
MINGSRGELLQNCLTAVKVGVEAGQPDKMAIALF